MSDIFVSYARPDEAQARAIAEALRGLGYSVWLDDQLPVHRAYSDVIEERLQAAKAVVVAWSADAARSQWVRAEADVAREAGTLVQLSLDGVMPPLPFNQIQCANLTGWSRGGAEPGWRKVVASVADLIAAASESLDRPQTAIERRHLTVLSCKLYRSGPAAHRLDPEEWHLIGAEYRSMVAEVATRFDGLVARTPGETVFVYFGYPIAQEDAAERAVRTGLAILEAMAALDAESAQSGGADLSVRVAVHSGMVFVAGGRDDIDISGDAPDIAARVQAAAAPGALVITDAVRDLVADLFDIEAWDGEGVDGADGPIRLHRVVSGDLPAGRERKFSQREPTPFVGRGDEAALLLSRWAKAREGEGQLVLVMGEPGIGKSRLIEEFKSRIGDDPSHWTRCGGAQLFVNSPFHAATQILDDDLGPHGEETPEARVGRLERLLEPTGMNLSEAVPLFADLLNLPAPAAYPPMSLPPDQKRRRLLAALVGWVFNARPDRPRILVIEDLHWVDPSTMELLQTLVEQGSAAPLLLLCTARPEFRLPWSARAHHTQIVLGRLSNREARELVRGITSRAGLAADVADAIIRRTDGVPLFAEELTRLMLEGGGRAGPREIPLTLQDSLAARLDRLGRAKPVAQLGAVLGREFSYELIRAVSSAPEHELQWALAKLADFDLIQVRGLPPEATYQFRHALIQDAAYEALLKTRRSELHGRVAETIEDRFPGLAESHPEVLARHWSAAGHTAKALEAWTRAAMAAKARHAYSEAEEDYRQALANLAKSPESPERDAHELQLLTSFVRVLQITHGYSAADLEAATARARALAEKGGDLRKQFAHVQAQWAAASSAGDYQISTGLAEQLLPLAQAQEAPELLATAYMAIMSARLRVGDLAAAEEAFVAGRPLFTMPAAFRGRGMIAQTFGNAAISACIMGDPDEARRRIEPVMDLIRTNDSPYELAFCQFMTGLLALNMEEWEEAETFAAQSMERSADGGFPQFAATSSIVLGHARSQLGRPAEGLQLMLDGIQAMRVSRSRAGLPMYLTWLAETRALTGSLEEALRTVDDALSVNPQERLFLPESLRSRGELRSRSGDRGAAEADLRSAEELARSMGARLFEQRAAASLEELRRTVP